MVWDRAVGQMQFLPQTWQAVARDGDGDGRRTPTTSTTARWVQRSTCAVPAAASPTRPGSPARRSATTTPTTTCSWSLSFQSGYQTGVFAVPSPPPPPEKKTVVRHVCPREVQEAGARKHSVAAAPKPRCSGHAHEARHAQADPQAHAEAQPRPRRRRHRSWTGSTAPGRPAAARFCLGTTNLDLGPQNALSDKASADFDDDGTVESNAQEFAGLVGQHGDAPGRAPGRRPRRLRDRVRRLPQRGRFVRPDAGGDRGGDPRTLTMER